MGKPNGAEILDGLVHFPLNEPSFSKLATSNIGAVIMPWMLAYQQTALCEKGLAGHHATDHLSFERIDTAVGSFITQGVMAAMLITVAATPQCTGEEITTPDQLLVIFSFVMGGEIRAKIALTFAICGSCIVAAIVVSLCGAWALEEAMGRDVQQESMGRLGTFQKMWKNVHRRPIFYMAYIGTCCVAWFVSVVFPSF